MSQGRSREELLTTALHSLAEGIIVFGPEGEVLTANERFYEVCGIPGDLKRNESEQRYIEYASSLLVHSQESQSEIERLRNCGEETWGIFELRDGRLLDVSSRPLVLDGRRARMVSVRDITMRKQSALGPSAEKASGGVNTTSLGAETAQAPETLRHSEDKFARAFQVSPDAQIISRAKDGLIMDANDGFCALTGHRREEVIGKTMLDIGLWGNRHADCGRFFAELRASGKQPETEQGFRTKSGRTLDCTICAEAISIGHEPCALSIIRDISKRKQAEMELLREKQFTEKLLEGLPGIFFLYDSTYHLKRWNKAHETSMGYSADELRDWYIPRWHETPEDAATGMSFLKRVLETGIGGAFETTLIRSDGHFVPFLLSITRLLTPDGPVMMGVGIDITERKQIEEALSASEKRFRGIALNLPGVVYQFYARENGEKGFRFVSDRVLEVLGLDKNRNDLFERFVRGIPPERRQGFLDSLETAIREVKPFEYEGDFRQSSGKELYVRILSQPEKRDDEVMFYGMLLDVTDRHRAEEQQERLTAILDNTNDVVAMFHPEGGLFYLNAAGRRMQNWDETGPVDSHVLSELYPPWAYNLLRQDAMPEVDQTGFWQGETSLLGAGGRETPVSQLIMAHRAADGHIEHYSSIMRDITERTRIEQQRLEIERRLLHSQKLESLGVLAGGIAHDFNNLLMAISGNLDLALLDLSPAEPARESIAQAVQAAQRASDLTRQMLAYSGKGRFIIDNIDLTQLVLENAHLLRASIAKTASFRLNVKSGLALIEADPGQVQQVVMNLITNASEALGDQAGEITLTTGERDFDEDYLQHGRVEHKPPPGRFVFLEVSDTGCGMDETTLARLFDPFFTTKFTGRGLGMAAVLGIVKGHRGTVFVDSTAGQGSVIRVLFPVVQSAGNREDEAARTDPAGGSALPFSGSVLVVDDEEPVRRVCNSYLARLGMTTLCASNGEEAIRLFEQHAHEIVCVVLDLNMPTMDGLSAFRAMKSLRPDVQVILCSGYNEQEATRQFLGEGLASFLQKPFRLQDLQKKLAQILSPGCADQK